MTMQWRSRSWKQAVLLGLVAASGCGDAPVTDFNGGAEAMLAAPPGSCSSAADCVSGMCRLGQCAVCTTLDFERSADAQPVTNGAVVENLYAPAYVRAFKDSDRRERGLAIAYSSSANPRLAGQGNVVISQATFGDEDVVRGFVDTPSPVAGPAAIDFEFPEALCVDSLTFIGLNREKDGKADLFGANGALLARRLVSDGGGCGNVSFGLTCGVSRLAVTPRGPAALDDVRVCTLGRAPSVAGATPGRSCGTEVVTSVEGVADPCVDGTAIATKKLNGFERSLSLPFAGSADSTLCLRLAGDVKRTKRVALDGLELAPADDGVSPLETRSPSKSGSRTLTVDASLGLGDLDVTVLSASGSFDSRVAVRSRGLLVTETEEAPDVFAPGSSTSLSAVMRVGNIAALSPLTLFYEFSVYSPDSCSRVASLSGSKSVLANARVPVAVTWDGKDRSGKALPDGNYLWNARLKVVPVLAPLAAVEVTTAFRGVRIWGQVPAGECRKKIQQALAATPVPNANARFDVMRDFLRCGADTATACDIDLFAAINLQRRHEADRLLNDQLSPAEYLRFQQDRTRKVGISDRDRSFVADYCRGDVDGDLIPDGRDACPDTPSFAATDDRGCTADALPPAPSRDDVRRLLGGLRFSYAPGCPVDVSPEGSEIVSGCQTEQGTFRFVVRKDQRMPADCPVWYMLRGFIGYGLDQIPPPPGEPEILVGPQRKYIEFALGPPLVPSVRPEGLEYTLSFEELGFRPPAGFRFRFAKGFAGTVDTVNGAGRRSESGKQVGLGLLACP